MAGHTNAAPRRPVPGHPALLPNASSTWDVQLDTVPGPELEVSSVHGQCHKKTAFWTSGALNVANR